MREKIIELLMQKGFGVEGATIAADHLIDNGMTIPVRCGGCKQWIRNTGIVDSPNGHCFYHDEETNGHDFCSYGERSEGE